MDEPIEALRHADSLKKPLPGKKYRVLDQQREGRDSYRIAFLAPDMADRAAAGRFVMVKCGEGLDPLLRRPLSLHMIEPDVGLIHILYRVAGRGTQWLSERRPGDRVDIFGPLGRGFSVGRKIGKAWLAAGGIGVAPLYALARVLRMQEAEVVLFYGARDKYGILGPVVERFHELGCRIHLSTEDGSLGRKGFVTDLFNEFIGRERPDFLYVCGPEGMTGAMGRLANQYGIPGEASLEARMACGVGACLGCACETKAADGSGKAGEGGCQGEAGQVGCCGEHSDNRRLSRVCVEGPVFGLDELVFEG